MDSISKYVDFSHDDRIIFKLKADVIVIYPMNEGIPCGVDRS